MCGAGEHTTMLRKRKLWIMVAFTYCGLGSPIHRPYTCIARFGEPVQCVTARSTGSRTPFVSSLVLARLVNAYPASHQKWVSTGSLRAQILHNANYPIQQLPTSEFASLR